VLGANIESRSLDNKLILTIHFSIHPDLQS